MEKSHDKALNLLDGEWALLSRPAVRPAANGFVWLWRAAKLFGQYWLRWLGLGVFITLCQAVIWVVSQQMSAFFLLLPLLMLMFSAGILNAASVQEFDREPPRFSHLFAALESGSNYTYLLTFYLLLLLMVVGVGYGSSTYLLAQYRHHPEGLALPLLLAAGAWVLLWFAPALVFLQGENPIRAIGLSIQSSLKNLLSMLPLMIVQLLLAGATVYFAILRANSTEHHGLLEVAAIALWVFFQVFGLLCCYTSYRDIWFEHLPNKKPSAPVVPVAAAHPSPEPAAHMPEPAAITHPIKTNPASNRNKRRAKKR